MRSRSCILVALLALVFSALLPRSAAAQLIADRIHGELNFTSTLKFAPDGRLFCLETWTGRVMVYRDTAAVTPSVWATLPVVTSGEHGLLGLAFHPQFPDSPFVYLYHTNPSPFFNRVVRMTDSAGVGTAYTVILDSLWCYSDTHQSGRVAFGPDRMLYVTVGDQYVSTTAQDLSVLQGKILRMTTTGRAAPGNPFGPFNRIAAYGIRNSYGLCFDPVTGYGYFTDNGPDCDDELNFFQIAANYGWGPDDSCFTYPAGTKAPMWMTSPTTAPTGICVYHGRTLLPYDGHVFFTSYNGQDLRDVTLDPQHPDVAASVQVVVTFPAAALDVTEGPDEHLWVATADAIWRLGPPPVSADGAGPAAAAWMPGPTPFTNRVALAARGGQGLRSLQVLDVTGRRVKWFAGPIGSSLIWDGQDEAGRAVPAGVYLVRAETDRGPVTRRIVRLAR